MDLKAAVQLHRSGKIEEAERVYRRILAAEPANASAIHMLGVLLQQTGRSREGISMLNRSIELAPGVAEFHSNLAAAFGSLERHAEAIPHLHAAIRLKPNYPEAHNNLGVALESVGRLEAAAAAYREATRLHKGYAQAHNHLGNALRKLGRIEEAVVCHNLAISLQPDYANAYDNLAAALGKVGDQTGVVNSHRRSLALRPHSAAAHSSLLVSLHYAEGVAPAELAAEAREWARRHGDPLFKEVTVHANSRSSERRLRIGYVSPDFRRHAVGHMIEPVLAERQRDAFEVFCYSDVRAPDVVTQRLRGLADHWRETRGMLDAAMADLVRSDAIDILIDLAGHFAGNRLLVFARKPAPVQITQFGYCDTTGMTAMDYRLTDAHSDPPGENDSLYSEKLIRLTDAAWCYRPSEPAAEIGPPPSASSGRVVFGSLNNPIKITDRVVRLWSTILRAVPGARLLLLGETGAASLIAERFARFDIGEERLEFSPTLPYRGYLEQFNRIDVALDPFPYNGDNSTCDALWMGVPVVALAGNTYASRRGVSHLRNVGLEQFVAPDEVTYASVAAALALDAEQRAALRLTLRERLRHSPVGDAKHYTNTLQREYRSAWRHWCGHGVET